MFTTEGKASLNSKLLEIPTSDGTPTSIADSPAGRLFPLRPLVTHVAGDVAFSCARSWISECRGRHKNCHCAEDHVLPTRLVDVGCDSLDASMVRLCIVADHRSRV